MCCWFFLCVGWGECCGFGDLSSLTRDQTHAPCMGVLSNELWSIPIGLIFNDVGRCSQYNIYSWLLDNAGVRDADPLCSRKLSVTYSKPSVPAVPRPQSQPTSCGVGLCSAAELTVENN